MPIWARSILSESGIDLGIAFDCTNESGRRCPYASDFCTVTGFFGDSIRFRTNQSVVDELLLIKGRAQRENGRIGVFFIDDNFAINIRRTKSLMGIALSETAYCPTWVAQIIMNLLRDEELLDLISRSGGRWIFIGLESIDTENLKDVNKGFNKPAEYAGILQNLADRGLYAITSFIFGNDFAVPVEQRAAGVAGVDGGVGLDGFVDDHAVGLLHLADGTDDAAREACRRVRTDCRWHRLSGRPAGWSSRRASSGWRSGALIWTTARSCDRSVPTMVALYFLRLWSVTSTWRASAMTW